MRVLLESSWMRFGPAGRGSYDWVTGAPPTQDQQVCGVSFFISFLINQVGQDLMCRLTFLQFTSEVPPEHWTRLVLSFYGYELRCFQFWL